jgi:hypothetical protein
MPNLNYFLLISLTLHMSPTVSEFMQIIFHTCRVMKVCELTLAIITLGQEQVPRDEKHEG